MIKRTLKKITYGKKSKLDIVFPNASSNICNFVLVKYNANTTSFGRKHNVKAKVYHHNLLQRIHKKNYSEHLKEFIIKLIDHIHYNKNDSVRHDGRTLSLYSNDIQNLEQLGYCLYDLVQQDKQLARVDDKLKRIKDRTIITFYSAPDALDENTVIMSPRMTGWDYKLYVKDTITPLFGEWLINNSDQLRMSNSMQRAIGRQLNLKKNMIKLHSKYFYLKSESMLLLVKMSFGTEIGKIKTITIQEQ